MRTETMTVGGLQFAFLEHGRGPLLLAVHGFPDTPRTWAPYMEAWAGLGYRVVAPFMRGYPPTHIPEGGLCDAYLLPYDVLGWIEALGESRASIVGHDWGAFAAYGAAALAPERVERLVAIAIPPLRALRPSLRLAWAARHFVSFQLRALTLWRFRRADLAFVDTLYRRWAPRWQFTPEVTADAKATLRQPGALEAALSYYWTFRDGARGQSARDLRRAMVQPISVPVLNVFGDADPGLGPAQFAAARAACTGPYHQLVVPNAGHWPHLEDVERVRSATLDFLRRG